MGRFGLGLIACFALVAALAAAAPAQTLTVDTLELKVGKSYLADP